MAIALSPECVWADDDDFGSALQVGVGGAYTAALTDPATCWANPAAPSLAPYDVALNISRRRLFNLEALEENTGSAHVRVGRQVTIAGGFSHFGQSGLFQETRGIVGLSHVTRKNLALGVSIGYQRIEFGSGAKAYSGATINWGAVLSPVASVAVGAAVREIRVDRLYDTNNQPAHLEVSAAWSAPPDITLAGIWSTESDGRSRFGLGQRLLLARDFLHATRIEFLSGLRFDPVRYALGGHIAVGGGWIDYVYQSHPDLGGTHAFAFTYAFPAP